LQDNYGPPPPAPTSWYVAPVPQAASQCGGRGLAITSLILSALVLLGVIALAAWLLIARPLGDTGSSRPLTGQLSQPVAQGALAGGDLSKAVSARIDQDGGDVSRMDCPDTPRVIQGAVTVCHGVVSGSDYAIVVYFEDEQGHFTLNPL
jgi:hypothetical protein